MSQQPKIEPGRFEQTTPLLRPDEVQERESEIRGMEELLNGPPHIRDRIQDRRGQTQRIRTLAQQLEEQRPQPYSAHEVDKAVSRETELRQKIQQGMPTDKEQRRNPAGNVGRHQAWETRNKEDILERKNIVRRLVEGGQMEDHKDVASVEMFRPVGGAREANMDNCAIPGKDYHFGPSGMPPVTNVMSDEDREAVEQEKRDLQAMLDEAKRELAEQRASKTSKRKPSEWNRIMGEARKLGIKTKGKKRPQIEAEIAAKKEG